MTLRPSDFSPCGSLANFSIIRLAELFVEAWNHHTETRVTSPSVNTSLTSWQAHPLVIPDSQLLKSLHGRRRLDLSSTSQLFAEIFFLRHATLQILMCRIETLLTKDNRGTFRQQLLRKWGASFPLNMQETEEVLRRFQGAAVPDGYQLFISFSALGTHLYLSSAERCQAFDAYDCPGGCPLPSVSHGYCHQHQAEAWWAEPDSGNPTTVAMMSPFFADTENVFLYGEEALRHLVERFWSRLAHRHHRLTAMAFQEAMGYFGFSQESPSCGLNVEVLRREFLQRARALHPDAGGTAGEFATLRAHYETLRTALDDRGNLCSHLS